VSRAWVHKLENRALDRLRAVLAGRVSDEGQRSEVRTQRPANPGAMARAAKMTPERRAEVARKAAQAKWARVAAGASCQSRGESHFNTYLTEDQVREIRRLYVPGKYGFRRLAHQFGVSASAISQIIKRRTWAHVDDAR